MFQVPRLLSRAHLQRMLAPLMLRASGLRAAVRALRLPQPVLPLTSVEEVETVLLLRALPPMTAEEVEDVPPLLASLQALPPGPPAAPR